jgi:hypothetical protein
MHAIVMYVARHPGCSKLEAVRRTGSGYGPVQRVIGRGFVREDRDHPASGCRLFLTEAGQVLIGAGGSLKFDMYAVPPPPGPWNYALDEPGIVYRRGLVAQRLRPGWWPFAYGDARREHEARRRRLPPVPPECGAASVRLCPDYTAFSWHNEYVTVVPDAHVPHQASARLTLWVIPRGMGAMVTQCTARFDLRAGSCQVTGLHPGLPAAVRAEAEEKADKISAYLAAEVRNRDGDARQPKTAADVLLDRRSRPGEWRRAYLPGPPGRALPMQEAWERDVGDGKRRLMAIPGQRGRWRWGAFLYNRAAGHPLVTGDAPDGPRAMLAADRAAGQAGRLPEAQA